MATIANICDNSSTSTENSELNCPICLEIPKKEIYLCSKGHSICGSCIETVKRCPECRTKLSGSLTDRARNFMAEALLDKMEFECPWKDFGCEDLISRDQFSNHEETCKFSPIYACSVCVPAIECQYPFPAYLVSSPDAVKALINHMKNAHGFSVKMDCLFGSINTINFDRSYFQFENNRKVHKCTPTFVEIVDPNPSISRSELIMLMYQFKSSWVSPIEFSWAFVWLTEETSDPNYTIKVNCSIRGDLKSDTAVEFGPSFATQASWTVTPMKVSEFKKYLKIPIKHRPQFPCALAVPHIQKFCLNSDGVFTLYFYTYKEKCQKL